MGTKKAPVNTLLSELFRQTAEQILSRAEITAEGVSAAVAASSAYAQLKEKGL